MFLVRSLLLWYAWNNINIGCLTDPTTNWCTCYYHQQQRSTHSGATPKQKSPQSTQSQVANAYIIICVRRSTGFVTLTSISAGHTDKLGYNSQIGLLLDTDTHGHSCVRWNRSYNVVQWGLIGWVQVSGECRCVHLWRCANLYVFRYQHLLVTTMLRAGVCGY